MVCVTYRHFVCLKGIRSLMRVELIQLRLPSLRQLNAHHPHPPLSNSTVLYSGVPFLSGIHITQCTHTHTPLRRDNDVHVPYKAKKKGKGKGKKKASGAADLKVKNYN